MIKFIVDTQLPPKLSRYLRAEGYDTRHTTDFPTGHLLKDPEIIQIAIDEQRIIVTKDQDFFDNYLLKGPPPVVLLLEFGNIGNKELIDFFIANQPTLLNLLEGGSEMILFSRERITEYKL